MGRKSIKTNKTMFQLSRENAGLTREEAGEKMIYVSEDRIEKIENERSNARPEEVVAMSHCYEDPLLCNRYCSQACPIGRGRVSAIQEKDLPQVSMEILNAVNHLHENRDAIIRVASAGELKEDEMDELIDISVQLEQLSRSVDSLKLWLRKKMDE